MCDEALVLTVRAICSLSQLLHLQQYCLTITQVPGEMIHIIEVESNQVPW